MYAVLVAALAALNAGDAQAGTLYKLTSWFGGGGQCSSCNACGSCQSCQSCQTCPPGAMAPGSMTPTPADPSMPADPGMQADPNMPAPLTQPAPAAPSPFTAASSSRSVAPNMIGDFFGSTGGGAGSGSLILYPEVPNPSTSVVGRQKIAENTSPIPQDRVYINYSYFDNVPITSGGVNVHRYTPGIEKTFNDGWNSIEVRLPFASTLDSDIDLAGSIDTSNVELGNLTLYFKQLLYQSYYVAWSAGLGVTIPTADDLNADIAGARFIRVENESVHLLPFLGVLYTPNDRAFAQAYAQLDWDTNGNDVYIHDGANYQLAGNAHDATFLYLDAAIGYWIYRNNYARHITGLAPMLELHYSRSLEGADVVTGTGGQTVGVPLSDIQVLNGVIGLTTLLGDSKTLTLGYVTPIGNGADQQFDGELRVFFNCFFGAGGRGGAYSTPRYYR